MFKHEITEMKLKDVMENYAPQNAFVECFSGRVFVTQDIPKALE